MSKAGEKALEKAKEPGKEPKEVPFEQVLGALEQRVDGLAGRIRDLVSENARLKGAVLESAADRDRFQKELQDLKKVSEENGQAADRVQKMEADREQVRARIERLLTELERAEAPPAEG